MGWAPLQAPCGAWSGGELVDESCQNCKYKTTCLYRSTTIYLLFIATGRDNMVPEARENMNIRPTCDHWAPAEPT